MSLLDVSKLCKHVSVKEIKEKMCKSNSKCMDLIAYSHDMLYLWDSSEAYVHTVNIKHAISDSDLNTQLLLCPAQGMLFSPDRIFLNESSSLLALCSSSEERSGIAVIELPERWTMNRGQIKVSCINLGERLFLGEQLTLRQAKWHPASPTDSHMLVLTSDECLRLYSVLTGEVMWKCILSQSINRPTHSTLPSKVSLGDTPVDFDIGPPQILETPSRTKWPVLVLWGNGDIYCVETNIVDSRDKIPAYGPLRMFPSSDDNYGSDACSILALNTSPPIVSFSTSVGAVYNCLLLPSEEQHGNESSLYVMECVELELGISIDEEDDIISCPIRMMRNPIEKSMYFLVHKAGIHSVTLPLVSKLYEFLDSNETEFTPYYNGCLVEYLFCTGLAKGSSLETLPLLGCTFVDLSSSLLVLQNSRDMINIKITPHILHSTHCLEVNLNHNADDDGFLMYIQNILKKNAPGPVIQLPQSDPRDLFNLIYRNKSLYKATMDAHELVAKKLEAKSKTLLSALRAQQEEVIQLDKEQKELYSMAKLISSRYLSTLFHPDLKYVPLMSYI